MDPVTDFFSLDDETDQLVRGAVVDIVSEDLSRAIDVVWLGGLEIPIATTIVMHKLRNIVNLSNYPLDGRDLNLEKRIPDREPAPPSIDTWARGIGE